MEIINVLPHLQHFVIPVILRQFTTKVLILPLLKMRRIKLWISDLSEFEVHERNVIKNRYLEKKTCVKDCGYNIQVY